MSDSDFKNSIRSEDTAAHPRGGVRPRVSVIIPAYRCAGTIGETLDSVFAQTFTDFEVIVVNDGSPDTKRLEQILAPYLDRIVYRTQKNAGAAVARNTAIEAARGEYIAFLDADDLWRPEKLAVQIDFLKRTGFEMAYCDAEFFGTELYSKATFMKQAPSRGTVTPISLISADCNVITSGTIVSRAALERCGGFDPATGRSEDFELWFRLAKNGVRIGYLRDVLIAYRVGAAGLSGDNIRRAEREIASLEIIRDKNRLTEPEEAAWRKRMKRCRAELCLEKGKTQLVGGNFAAARKNFREANRFFRKLKYSLIDQLLGISPRLALLLFKKTRPTEYTFIASPDRKG